MPYGTNAVIVESWGGVNVDEAPHTTARHTVGMRVHDSLGREYIYCKFGAAVAQYETVQPTATATPYTAVVKNSAANQAVLGAYFHATSAALNDYGWVVRGPMVAAKVAAGTAAGGALQSGASGTLAALAAGPNPQIVALTAIDTPVSGASWVAIK
jgi:hypothetical protein